MSTAEVARGMTEALETAATREAPCALVSVTVDVVSEPRAGSITTALTRKTRTLLFLSADLKDQAGALIATANSVHKVLDT